MPIVKVEAETVQRVMEKIVGLGVIGTVNESFDAVLNGFARLSDEEAAEILGLNGDNSLRLYDRCQGQFDSRVQGSS